MATPASVPTSTLIDRASPRRRPAGLACGWQQWRSLSFLHWPVSAEDLRRLIPSPLELDCWQDRAYVGIVPFLMQEIRPYRWWPARFAMNFPETNVRTYVHLNGRPGVYFLSLDAGSWLAVQAARRLWSLPYFQATMSVDTDTDKGGIHYRSQRAKDGPRLSLDVKLGEALPASVEGSAEYFFLERYLLFVQHRGRLHQGQVHHPPYPVQAADVCQFSESLVEAAGLPAIEGPPEFAHFSPGVDVEIFSLERC